MSLSGPHFPEQQKHEEQPRPVPVPVEPTALERRPVSSRRLMVVKDERDGEEAERPALALNITPLTLLVALRRRWQQALPLGLLLAGLMGALIWSLRPELYTSFALLRVPQVEQKILQDANARTDAATERANQFQKTQVALITSRPVLRAALKDEQVHHLALIQKHADPVDWLERELKAELVTNTDLLRLELSSREHPEELKTIVQAVQKAYMKEIVAGDRNQQLALLKDMEEIYAKAQVKIRRQRESLRSLADSLKTGDSQILTIKQKNMLEEYAALRKELAGLDAKLRDTSVKLAAHQVRLKKTQGDAKGPAEGEGMASLPMSAEREIDVDPMIQKLASEVVRLQENYEQARRTVRAGDPFLAQREKELQQAKESLEKIRTERRQAYALRLRQDMLGETLTRAQEVRAELNLLQEQRTKLEAEANRLGKDVDNIGVQSTELELMRNEIEQAELVLKTLRSEKERLQVELSSENKHRVFLVAQADDATVLKKNRRLLESAAGAMFGLCFGLFAVSFREVRTRKLYTANEVSTGLRLRVVGTLPRLPDRHLDRKAELEARGSWSQLLVESIDSIRTLLLESQQAEGSAVLMVASACGGEGKTTLATHLATSLARGGRRTLLIDCDLRSPSLHRLFDLSKVPGICELLCGASTLPEAVHETPVAGLHLLPAGKYSADAATALARGEMHGLLEQLRGQFDFLVVDTSPVLAVSDALMIGKSTDGVVLSVRPGVSQSHYVWAAYERLREMDMPFIGTVVNGVNDDLLYSHNQNYLKGARA